MIGRGEPLAPGNYSSGGYAKALGKPIEPVAYSISNEQPEPTCRLSPEAAQQLMDQLWQVGIRPTEGTGSAGSLAATQQHLNDMRAIVSKQLEVPLNHAVQR